MKRGNLFIAAAIVAALVWLARPALANDTVGFLVAGESESPQHRVASIHERRFAGIVQEHIDFSCGAAVLATLFRDAYDAPVDEADVFKGMLNVADSSVVSQRGFSLLDIKNYAKQVGLAAEGYDLSLGALRDLKVPGIVLLDYRGYHHFALIRRADDRFAYIADPAIGNRILSLKDFASEWNGIVLVVLGTGYRSDNVLSRTLPPLGARELLANAPSTQLPGITSTMMFDGTPAIQRL